MINTEAKIVAAMAAGSAQSDYLDLLLARDAFVKKCDEFAAFLEGNITYINPSEADKLALLADESSFADFKSDYLFVLDEEIKKLRDEYPVAAE